MAYNYTKLNEVTLVDSAVAPNLLIEDDGVIKRLPAENVSSAQVQVDWNETDPTKASFILNKPESNSGSKVITYTYDSGALYKDGIQTSASEVYDEWNNGSNLKIKLSDSSAANITNLSYTMVSGVGKTTLKYFNDEGTFTTVNI